MNPLSRSLESLEQLIRFPSISSAGNVRVSEWVAAQLGILGFTVETTSYRDGNGIEKRNLVARRDPASPAPDLATKASDASNASEERYASGGLAYFCHTDVVPAHGWTGPGGDPFDPQMVDGRLFGRGACDMKGSLATMMSAVAQVSNEEQSSPLWIVCTADEEVGFTGAKYLVEHSDAYRQIVAHQPVSIIGEPTRLGVVHAHKGIIGLRVTSRGRAAHSSTRDGVNANRRMVPMLQTLLEINEQTNRQSKYMDQRFDPPTLSWNFGVSDSCDAVNITPEKSVAWVSMRPMPRIDGNDLLEKVESRAEELGLEFQVFEGGSPFWVEPTAPCIEDFCKLAGGTPSTVCYGTDGGEFHELKHRVVIGPGDIAQAHTTDEWIELSQLEAGVALFTKAIRRWATNAVASH